MSSFTDFLENELLDHVFGDSAYTAPSTLYIGLSTTTPNDDGSNFTEVSGNNYARVAVSNNLTEWPAASGGSKTNGNAITFPEATGSWGTITHAGIFDASSGGNLLAVGPLDTSRTIDSAEVLEIPATGLTITLD